MTSPHLATANGLIDYFKCFLNTWINRPQLLFIVDGLERLDTKDALHLLDWLNEICKTGRVKAIVSAENSFDAPLDTLSHTLGSLDAQEVDVFFALAQLKKIEGDIRINNIPWQGILKDKI